MYQLVYPTLLLSIAFRLWQIYLPKIVRQCGQLSSTLPGIAAYLWWAMMIGWVIWVDISGQSDILVLADVPHPLQIRIALNMNPIEQNHFKRGHQEHFTIYPPPFQYHYQILCLNRKLVNFNFKWIWIYGFEPHLIPLTSPQKNEMLIFGLCSTSDDGPGWSMDSNHVCHPSPAKKMKCSFLDYVQLLMMGWAGWWTRIPSTTPLQPEKWTVHFWIMFNFWWLAGLLDGLEPHPPSLSSQKNEMLIFRLHSTSGDRPSNPSNKSQPKCDKRPPKSL